VTHGLDMQVTKKLRGGHSRQNCAKIYKWWSFQS